MSEIISRNEKITWTVESRDDWDSLFRRSVPYYWYGCGTNPDGSAKEPSLYDVYNQMGVTNIIDPRVAGCINPRDQRGVIFYRDGKKEREFILVRPTSDRSRGRLLPEFKADGWHNLYSELTFKIPKCVVLPAQISIWFDSYSENLYELNLPGSKSKERGTNGFLEEVLVEDIKDALENMKAHAKKHFDSEDKLVPSLLIVEISDLMVLLGRIDHFFNVFHNKPTPIYNQFKLIDLEIYSILTALLAQWIELECYFPFGFIMSGITPLLNPCPLPLSYTTTECPIPSGTAQGESSIGAWDAAVVNSNTVTSDRGGSSGMDSDYDWQHAAPKLVSYNWQSMRALNGGIKDGDRLSNYPDLLKNVGFSIPDFTDMVVKLEESLPVNIQCDGGKHSLEWNLSNYASALDVEYPNPPAPRDRPMALSDLLASRANEPFTSL
jgi:hypothetical protein